jgi:hypothetical protein
MRSVNDLPNLEINFPFRGERKITRLGGDDRGKRIVIFLEGGRHKIAAQLASQLLQHGVSRRVSQFSI